MLANPKVSLLVVDPVNTARSLAIRGEVELIEEGALDHLDQLTRRYTRHPHYYGSISPVEQQARKTRIICRHLLHPCHENHSGCHSHLTLPFSQDRLSGTLNVMAL